jgi:hypothetical protein
MGAAAAVPPHDIESQRVRVRRGADDINHRIALPQARHKRVVDRLYIPLRAVSGVQRPDHVLVHLPLVKALSIEDGDAVFIFSVTSSYVPHWPHYYSEAVDAAYNILARWFASNYPLDR